MSWNTTSGTQAATVGTEVTIATPATVGTYEVFFDTSNLAVGEVVELRVYKMAKTGGAYIQVWKDVATGGQMVNPGRQAPPIANVFGLKYTLKQLTGTARNFDYEYSYV